jgi:hypothetical protein
MSEHARAKRCDTMNGLIWTILGIIGLIVVIRWFVGGM